MMQQQQAHKQAKNTTHNGVAQVLALHRQHSEQTLNTGISQQSNYLLLN